MQADLRLCWLRIPHCWKSHDTTHIYFWNTHYIRVCRVLPIKGVQPTVLIMKPKVEHILFFYAGVYILTSVWKVVSLCLERGSLGVPGLEVIKLEFILRLKKSTMVGCFRTRVRKQPIIARYFESETVLKFNNLEARILLAPTSRFHIESMG